MDCKLDEIQNRYATGACGDASAVKPAMLRARAAARALAATGETARAGETLTAATLAALVAGGRGGPCEVADLAARSAEMFGADPVRTGLLALSEPTSVALSPDDALQAHVALLAGLSGADAVAAWRLTPGDQTRPVAHHGRLPAEATRRSLARFMCGDDSDDSIVVVKAFGEPRAILAWVAGDGCRDTLSLLAGHSSDMLGIAFERAALLDDALTQQRALTQAAVRRLSRVAMDIHDGPLQNMALLRGELCALRAGLGSESCADPGRDPLSKLADLMAIAEATEADLRDLARSLQSSSLLERPFDEAVRGLARTFALRTGVEPTVELSGDWAGLTSMERVTLLRVTGEALSNAREHSAAQSVEIAVEVTASVVSARIVDDGRGFETEGALRDAASRGSMGLAGMIERVRLLGGTCEVQSRTGEGTTVEVRFDRYFPAQASTPVRLVAASPAGRAAA